MFNTPLPVSMYWPELENVTVRTDTASSRVPCDDLFSASQSLTVWSSEQDTTSLVFGENAAELTGSV